MGRWLASLAVALLLAGAAQAKPADGELIESRACPPRTQAYDDYIAQQLKTAAEEADLGLKAGVKPPSTESLRAALIPRAEYDAELKAPAACDFVYYGSDGLKVARGRLLPPARAPLSPAPIALVKESV